MAVNASSDAGLELQWVWYWVPCPTPAPCPGDSAASGHKLCISRCSQSIAYCGTDSKPTEPISMLISCLVQSTRKKKKTNSYNHPHWISDWKGIFEIWLCFNELRIQKHKVKIPKGEGFACSCKGQQLTQYTWALQVRTPWWFPFLQP